MANPFVRMMVNLVVMGAGVFSRAFVAAYQQAVQNAKSGGSNAIKSAARGGMATDEAMKVLNLAKQDMGDVLRIQKQYDKYFTQNDPSKGGSFYLQSKVFRAKEALDRELAELKKKSSSTSSGTGTGSGDSS